MPSPYRKKLIEVALPLDAINAESAREKSIRHGHPSTLHLWWARRPLAACRAVLFSQLVDDPSEYMPDEKSADEERERLFDLIEELVKWENINNEEVLDRAKLEIARSVARDLGEPVPVGKQAIREFLATKAPPVLDPFAGGGSIPLEAQRLGLRVYASDLNPVAVLINKALIEIPPKFAGMPPVHPVEEGIANRGKGKQGELWKKEWKWAQGLAEDVRYYGKWMRDEAYKRIGHLYPLVKITAEMLAERPDLKAQGLKPGDELTVIAWLWARTVKCPNPACGAQMPLISTFSICNKSGKNTWVEPVVNGKEIKFVLRQDNKNVPTPPKVGRGVQFTCLVCGQLAQEEYIKNVGVADHSKAKLMGIVAEGKKGRSYFRPDTTHEQIVLQVNSHWRPNIDLSTHPQYMAPPRYKMVSFADLHTERQLLSLTVLSELVQTVYRQVLRDARDHGLTDDNLSLDEGGMGSKAYAEAIAIYLGMNVSRQANRLSALCFWHTIGEKVEPFFTRQAYTMNWNFAEANPFSHSSGNFLGQLDYLTWVLESLPDTEITGMVSQKDALISEFPTGILVSTDPPYYDNVPYADLSDFFYVWLRKSLLTVYPSLFQTLLVPKKDELVADHQRYGGREEANMFFENGLGSVFSKFRKTTKAEYPVAVYYAFKQSESDNSSELVEEQGLANTGWETMLEGLLSAGFSINSTWPMRTEQATNIKNYRNALASSIVLVCRSRPENALLFTRRDFWFTLKQELPIALRQLQQGSVAPVDFAQAAIGPGMAVFSRYKQVLEADGSPMPVRTALALINQALDEFLAEQEGEYDADTRWALAWYEQCGFNDGLFGVAETLSKAKNTSVGGLGEAGILLARAGKVRLLSRTELKEDWDPTQDKRPTAWEAVQYLIRALDTHGEQGAALLLSRLGGLGETARDLAYRLYTICERKGWAQDALGYNMLVVAWPRLKEMARDQDQTRQERLF